ncbi:hypothetical protein TNCV_15231 [Trichonephila clavipes]|nr:hypothetical protein TNCV_15231 [Trichonephila clavipes]
MQALLMHYEGWQPIIQTSPESNLMKRQTYKEKIISTTSISINKVASSEFQSTVQQIYRWKEEDFRVVKIEAELILEANRLQLMKQDLEKAENAYLSSFHSKKSKTLPCATAAARLEIQMARMITKKKVVRKDNTESQGFSDLSEQQEALMVEVTIPNCYKQAIRSRDASKWHDAMDKEINVMNGT